MDDKQSRVSELAREVMSLSRSQLLVHLRFLDAALNRLELTELTGLALVMGLGFATDGRTLAYDPRHVLRCYRDDRARCVRDYLHIVFHCVFRHMFIHSLVDHTAWDLACDIAVEAVISGLGLHAAEAEREARQRDKLDELKSELGALTAERLYRAFLDRKLPPEYLVALRELFYADDHRLWYASAAEKAAAGLGSPEQKAAADGPSGEGLGGGGPSDGPEPGGGGRRGPALCSEEDWKDVAERIQVDVETFSKSQGVDPGAMLQNLREVNRERYDYAAFLRRFAVLGEVMRVNDDEFDYIFYTYGLRLYGKVPLIEPLEYKETKRVREFVVAIDTSGSVSGDTVQKFVQKTWNLLKSTESFFSKVNLHIIQCDAAIQEDVKISCQEDFDAYIKTMTLRGLGGTDFRPVFSYVERLREQKEFTNLRGLIYFTDGWGTFPEKMPDYETAFVFLDEADNNPDVPPWAIRLTLRDEEI